jgi:DNA-binding NarL/FixJ family response regulator
LICRWLIYVAFVAEDELRVVLADEHHLFREGLREVLRTDGMAVVGEASDSLGAVALASELVPDVVVMDLRMPDQSAIESIRQIVEAEPSMRVVVLTDSADDGDVHAALMAGARGYLLKDARAKEIAGAVRQAAAGNGVLDGEVLQAFVAQMPVHAGARSDTPDLTVRELDVLRLIADGADNAAIGRALSISTHTVKQYVTNILEKLEVRSRVQAAVYAVRAGLV